MSARGRSGGSSGNDGEGIGAWLPMIGGVAVGAGLLALIYKLFFMKDNCPHIDPKKRRWPLEKKSWFSFK
ncbi:uncharacterized protein LOC114357746 isoform X2 [Ostrinia furnacalis]|uniref:uncharacterized protein LOC114357746 isoform X2 n=1 Tax=Ostrinia furnacalis TaxID=93504 RepID=UPI00103FF0C1|nr:uncharacterized protein LOC114357746 isoform X2 [Ostrinia furnacalis]